MKKQILLEAEELMKKTLEKFRQEVLTIRTGRANVSMVENLKVECYSTTMTLNQIASLNVVEGKTIEIKPWDSNILPDIEKAILKSSLGITPINDGRVIRLTVPPLTEERRKELVKYLKKMGEEFKITIRNERRTALDKIKKLEKEKKISEDERYKTEEELQKLTNNYIEKIEEVLATKEKEILET